MIMAITEAYTGTAAISTTEYSCPNAGNYSSANAIAVSGVYQVFLDTADMVAGDQLQIRIYEKCRSGDTQRLIYEAVLVGTMADSWVSPTLILMNGWDVTLDALAGTITVLWSIRKVA
jgi:hypothetical protein